MFGNVRSKNITEQKHQQLWCWADFDSDLALHVRVGVPE